MEKCVTTIIDNTMFNACEKDDQRSIELKTLVEHGERDNMSFNSVSGAYAVDKQQEKELTVFRSMREKCVEKTHRNNSVLLNALCRKPAAASVLQQAETGCAMEQELFQSITTCANSGTLCNSTKIIRFES